MEAYIRIVEEIRATPLNSRPAWMLESNRDFYEDIKTKHAQVIVRRNRLHEEGVQRHDKCALMWSDKAWMENHNHLLYKASHAMKPLRGYSSFVRPEHFPGMIYDQDGFLSTNMIMFAIL